MRSWACTHNFFCVFGAKAPKDGLNEKNVAVSRGGHRGGCCRVVGWPASNNFRVSIGDRGTAVSDDISGAPADATAGTSHACATNP
ncbi:hypothetical protein KBC89_03135 [Candidatus Woesebacteria bacterium]|nr:hypothetical protein [Candidatus Woesebacteria bacterium]